MSVHSSIGLRARGVAGAAALLIGLGAVLIPSAAYATEGIEGELVAEDIAATEAQSPTQNEDAAADAPESSEDSDGVMTPFEVAETRTISGTISFDARTTLEQRQRVFVGATPISEDPSEIAVPVPAEQISYSPVDGTFSIVGLEPGSYKLGVRMSSPSGWSFSPGTEPGGDWDSAGTGTLGGYDIDVTESDQTQVEYFFDPALGGITIGGWALDMRSTIIATNVENGEEAEFIPVSGGASAEGIWGTFERTLGAGTSVTIRFVTEAGPIYYDGTPNGSLDAAAALPVTVETWNGTLIEMDIRPHLSATAPNPDWLTDENRGDVEIPAQATAGQQLTVFVGVNYAGERVYGWMFSDPRALGAAVVNAEGYATFQLPADLSGDHRMVVSTFGGWPIGWSEISIAAAPGGGGAGAGVGDTLAATGAPSMIVVGAAAGGLLLMGTALMLAKQRRARARV